MFEKPFTAKTAAARGTPVFQTEPNNLFLRTTVTSAQPAALPRAVHASKFEHKPTSETLAYKIYSHAATSSFRMRFGARNRVEQSAHIAPSSKCRLLPQLGHASGSFLLAGTTVLGCF